MIRALVFPKRAKLPKYQIKWHSHHRSTSPYCGSCGVIGLVRTHGRFDLTLSHSNRTWASRRDRAPIGSVQILHSTSALPQIQVSEAALGRFVAAYADRLSKRTPSSTWGVHSFAMRGAATGTAPPIDLTESLSNFSSPLSFYHHMHFNTPFFDASVQRAWTVVLEI